MKAFKYIQCEVKKYNNVSFQIYKNVKLKSIKMKAFKYIKCEDKKYKNESFQIYKMWS